MEQQKEVVTIKPLVELTKEELIDVVKDLARRLDKTEIKYEAETESTSTLGYKLEKANETIEELEERISDLEDAIEGASNEFESALHDLRSV